MTGFQRSFLLVSDIIITARSSFSNERTITQFCIIVLVINTGVEYWLNPDPPSPEHTTQCDPSGEDPNCSASIPSEGLNAAHLIVSVVYCGVFRLHIDVLLCFVRACAREVYEYYVAYTVLFLIQGMDWDISFFQIFIYYFFFHRARQYFRFFLLFSLPGSLQPITLVSFFSFILFFF
jgi:hypothetical protein